MNVNSSIHTCGFKELVQSICYDENKRPIEKDESKIQNLSQNHQCSSNFILYYIIGESLYGVPFDTHNANPMNDASYIATNDEVRFMSLHLCDNSDIETLKNLSGRQINTLDTDKCIVSVINKYHGAEEELPCSRPIRIRDRTKNTTTCDDHEKQYRTL